MNRICLCAMHRLNLKIYNILICNRRKHISGTIGAK